MSNLVLNGDFSSRGDHWTSQTTSFDGNVANVANIGHIKQDIILDSPLKKGDAVRIKFKVSAMYGSQVTVSVTGGSYPAIKQEGEHDIAIILTNDMTTNVLTLKFQASNAFTLDNVWLELENKACTPKDVIQNGDFSNPGSPGEHWTTGGNTSFTNGKANVAGIGHVKQEVTLDRALIKGDIVKVNFALSDLYGTVSVTMAGISHEQITTPGIKNIAFSIPSDHSSNKVILKFQASNAFGIDNIEMIVCL